MIAITIIIGLATFAGGIVLGFGSHSLYNNWREEREIRRRTDELYNEMIIRD